MSRKISTKQNMAVRRVMSDGGEFFDRNSIAGDVKYCGERATAQNGFGGPSWAKNNPVVRIVMVEVREIETALEFEVPSKGDKQ